MISPKKERRRETLPNRLRRNRHETESIIGMKQNVWISVSEGLPEEGKYVLARHNIGTWQDFADQENVNCVVVKLIKGMSWDHRMKMKNGEIPMEYTRDGVEKWRHQTVNDENVGNNTTPYGWAQFGPGHFFGQDITHWMPIQPLPKGDQVGNKP